MIVNKSFTTFYNAVNCSRKMSYKTPLRLFTVRVKLRLKSLSEGFTHYRFQCVKKTFTKL